MANKKLFYALWPSHRQRETLRDAINPVLSSVEGSAIDRRYWHVTLVYIGDFPEERIPELECAMEAVDPADIRLRFENLTYWQRPKIACVHTKTIPTELERLVTDMKQVLKTFDIEPEDRVYRPHITVARKARTFPDARLARPIELQWSEFALVESVTVRGEVQYRLLKQ